MRPGALMLMAALTASAFSITVQAADSEQAIQAQVRKLADRMEQLEQRNRELERELVDLKARQAGDRQPAQAGASATVEQRLVNQENPQAQVERALDPDRISDSESTGATRLRAVEVETATMRKESPQIQALEGTTVDATLTTMAQRVNRNGSATGSAESRLNYRGDVSVTLPGGSLGEAEGSLFAHVRFGQGSGIGLRPTYVSTPNTTAFEVSGVNQPDSSFAILAQAWYQLEVPLAGDSRDSTQQLVFNVGKIDPFVFFDQNAIADDETVRFTNNAFVHNPLLDSGGDVGADRYGFSPGVRLAYVNGTDETRTWGASLGMFGSGPATNFSGSPGNPFVIGQIEAGTRFFNGLPGNYRLYGWRNGRATDFDGTQVVHSGWGVSVNQGVHDAVTMFGRFGNRTSGQGSFDRALTVGAEIGGRYWNREADIVGLAAGLLHTSAAYRNATADGTLVGFRASGSERVAELYYRYRLNDRVDMSPNLQWIQRPGGDAGAPSATMIGLRGRFGI